MKFLHKYTNIIYSKLLLFFYLILSPSLRVYAQSGSSVCPDGKICNPLTKTTDISVFIKDVLEGALKIGVPVVALAIIYAGFLFVFARGNSEKLEKAKETLLYVLIGAAVLMGSWAIAQIITNTITSL